MAGYLPLVVGLGNPGLFYRKTRHNVGFEAVDQLAKLRRGSWKKLRFTKAKGCQIENGSWLMKPMDYMNTSGPVVNKAMQWFKLKPGQILIVVDDVNLPLGKLRLRAKGSAGGHNGLKSIEQALNTQEYPRLRAGVGASTHDGKDLKAHVLSRFSKEEWQAVQMMVEKSVEVIETYQAHGLDAAMQKGNSSL
ncbi:MAG: aminoacyl-tRNA hydrolase [Verrucomicrobiota bacterium]